MSGLVEDELCLFHKLFVSLPLEVVVWVNNLAKGSIAGAVV